MKNLHIKNSYKIWSTGKMRALVEERCQVVYGTIDVEATLNRSYCSLYTEWWLHNVGYYLTKPFCFNKKVLALNLRLKDIDLEERTARKK
jgi:hypothetical protein